MHPTPPNGFHEDDDEPLRRLQARLRRLATLARWQDRSTAENNELRADLEAAHGLIAAYQTMAGLDPADPPPPQLLHAWRTGSDHQPVTVDLDGIDVVIIVGGEDRPTNPVRAHAAWKALATVFRSVRGQARA